MKYGIIICPKCTKAKICELHFKTTRCFRCNKVIKLKEIRILYKDNSKENLQHILGLVNAEMDGKLDEFTKLIN